MPDARADLGRFAEPTLLILVSLSAGPKHGYAIMTDVEAGSGRPLGPGTLYAALAPPEEGRRVGSTAGTRNALRGAGSTRGTRPDRGAAARRSPPAIPTHRAGRDRAPG